MAHREIDYSKMADKYESRCPGKNLRSFCYHEKIDYRQMLKELRSRTAERQEKENSESGHFYPLKVVNEVPSLVEELFGCSNIKVTQHEVPIEGGCIGSECDFNNGHKESSCDFDRLPYISLA